MKAYQSFCVIALLAAPALVHAQEAKAPATAPEAPPAAAPATAPEAPPAAAPPAVDDSPAAKAKPKPKSAASSEAEDEDDEDDEEWGPDLPRSSPPSALDQDWEFAPRFRSGVSATASIFAPGPVYMFGLEGRSGFQANDLLAGYFSAGVMFGFSQVYLDSQDASFESSFGGLGYVNLMGEATFFDTLIVAVGPQLAFGAIVQESTYIEGYKQTSDASVFAGLLPGARLRLGVGFGSESPRRRRQFTFGVDASVLVGQSFRVVRTDTDTTLVADGLAAGVLPTFFLGFDSK